QLPRDLDLVRSGRVGEVALPAQPGLGRQSQGIGVPLAAIEAAEPAQTLGLDAATDALQGDLVVTHALRRHGCEVLFGEDIEPGIDLGKDPFRGPTPPLPITRTHVCIIANTRSVSSIFPV